MTTEQDKQHLQELAAYSFTVENLQARVAELEAQLAAVPQAVQAAVPVGWMNADTIRAMQDTPKSEKTRWPLYNLGEYASKEGMIPVYAATHPTQQGLDERLLSLDAELLVEAKRALWRLSQDYEDGELRLRAQEHLERIDERRCVGRENIFNSHAALAAQVKQGEQANG